MHDARRNTGSAVATLQELTATPQVAVGQLPEGPLKVNLACYREVVCQ